jgi:hypothetical protein
MQNQDDFLGVARITIDPFGNLSIVELASARFGVLTPVKAIASQ